MKTPATVGTNQWMYAAKAVHENLFLYVNSWYYFLVGGATYQKRPIANTKAPRMGGPSLHSGTTLPLLASSLRM